ncbi:MAG: hypothetical protein ACFFCW_37730 [Candidatus Hodarchaeota archaeon]
MSDLEHIAPILSRAPRALVESWEEQVKMRDPEEREIDASQESQGSFDDI